jgi:hypothetical protein
VTDRCITRVVARTGLRPNTVRDLKFVSELFNCQKLFQALKINGDS